ncbi:GNAT family N-acetyltransferase [Corynebacterium breve]|uniref:GNAT family N-acetyltransferase n=1 Tax=Corynebacterium breve TaxID=3049799 RepID=A0ABY8VIN1_9CORY|nr:GNAT family N-acetyltransferase [Corynebacterium breve]WIM67415.1 GNAT family N-acetyltransferase [Corynebacterium breve]
MTIQFSSLRLIDLSPLEVHSLYKLRVDVFVAEQKTPYQEIDDADADKNTRHILAWRTSQDHSQVIGATRVVPGEDITQIGRFVLAPDYRGTGLGDKLLRYTLRYVFENHPGDDVILDAQQPLVQYYEKYGFMPEGELFDDTGVPHQNMRLSAAKLAQLILKPAP